MPVKLEQLPDRQSALLRLAVNDARVVSRRKNTALDMRKLISFNRRGKCLVCMAGAVILRRSDVDPHDGEAVSRLFSYSARVSDFWTKFELIDAMRVGGFIYQDATSSEQYLAVSEARVLVSGKYNKKLGRAPWSVYLAAAKILERVGL